LDDAAAPNSSAVHAAYASQLIAEMEPSSRWLRAEGLRHNLGDYLGGCGPKVFVGEIE